jgi:hypothetical protein
MIFLSKHRVTFLNVLIILFSMNTMLAHSNCFVDFSAAEQDLSAQQNSHDSNMPCHTEDKSQIKESIKKDCCSVCSILVLTPDRAESTLVAQAVMIDIPLLSLTIRTLEIPFRPPISHLS